MKIGFYFVHNDIDIGFYNPIGFAHLVSYLRNNSNVEFDALYYEHIGDCRFAESLDVMGLTVQSQDFEEAKSIAENLKKANPDLLVLLGGRHISHFPRTLPECVDIGVIGEGELTFKELMELLDREKKFPAENLKQIRGIVFRDESGRLVQTPPRELVCNMDELGLPDRSIFSMDKDPYLFTSRGCPYKCSFCSASEFWKRPRYFSPEYVCKDIAGILERQPDLRVLGIGDDLFVADITRVEKIKDVLHTDGVFKKYDLQMFCQVRAHLINERLCKLLQQMRITATSFGFESVSDRLLKILKPNMEVSVENNLKALDMLKNFNITVCCSFVIGVPGETEDIVRKTFETILRLMEQNEIVVPHVNILMPMPNTLFWRYAEEAGLINVNNMRWSRLRYFCSFRDSVFQTPEELAQARLENKSVYLNEENVKEEKLLELIIHYENIIEKELQKRKSHPKLPYPDYVHVDLSNKKGSFASMLNRIEEGAKVLECGCSGGHMTQALARKNCRVDAIDKNDNIAQMAYPFAEKVLVGNLDDEDFIISINNDCYDYIILSDILHFLDNPMQTTLLLKEKLKPNGRIIAMIPNMKHGSELLKKMLCAADTCHHELPLSNSLEDLFSIVEFFNKSKLFIESFDVVRLPVDHPATGLDETKLKKEMVDMVSCGSTADFWQFVICARNMANSNEINNADSIYSRFFPSSAVPIAIAACGSSEHSPAAKATLLSRIKGALEKYRIR